MSSFDPLRFARFSIPNDDEWTRMVADAAYFLAEKRHFAPGSEIDDWLAAEEQLQAQLARRRLSNEG